MSKQNFLRLLAIILTLISFRFILKFIWSDFFASIYPGWNFTVDAEFWVLNYSTLVHGFYTLLMIILYKIWKIVLNLIIP